MTYLKSPFQFSLLITSLIIMAQIGAARAQTEKRLDSLYSALAKQGYFNGCVLVAENGTPVYEKAFGYANFDTKQPLTNQTMFELASVSKQFTSMAIMQLHEKGKLNYNDSLNKYFPAIPYHGITIANLLHHTSGIPEFLTWDEKQVDVSRINYNKDILTALIKNAPPLNFKPGDQLAYANTNYVLLALIVEKVSGLSFSDYMDKNIFKPLGMAHTRVYPQRAANPKIADYAYGYLYNPAIGGFDLNDHLSADRYEYYFDGVAGPYGISSNTEDMLKWDQALYTEKLVSHATQAEAYVTSKLNDGKDATFSGIPYGFGWLIMPTRSDEGRRYMHSGGYPGYMTIICRYPDHNKTIILLTNIYNVINLYELTAATEHILFNKPYTVPAALPFQKSLMLSPAQLKAIEGTFVPKLAPQLKFTITTENGQAYAQITGQPKVEIYPESDLDFFYVVVAAKIKFSKDDKGDIIKLTLFQSGQELVADKVAVK
jgi:CubicO group peptidase (beta-lactamase class C family)